MTDVPAGGIYDALSSVLVDSTNLQVGAGDLLVLYIVRDCSFSWISGNGDMEGEQFKYLDGLWSADTENWSGLKTMFR